MKDFNWKVMIIAFFLCALASAATPYVTLKLGQSVDLTIAGMFLVAYLFAHKINSKELAIQLNITQAMIGMVSSIAFMVVILSAFYYIKVMFNRDVNFDLSTLQMFLWLVVSANLGIFMGVLPRSTILKDKSLPWPSSRATLVVAKTLSDPEAGAINKKKRSVLMLSTAGAGFLTFLRDGFGVIQPVVGNPSLNIALSAEFAAFGIGMLVPLSVGLSGLLGTWIMATFGDTVAKYAALSGVSSDNFKTCLDMLNNYSSMAQPQQTKALEFLTSTCGKASEYVNTTSHFKLVVQWMMWPATAMMIAAALTSIAIPVIKHLISHKKIKEEEGFKSIADEHIPNWWTWTGVFVSVILLVWMTSEWFEMPWTEVMLAVAIQPILIIAGLRVLGITGYGPVSLMANATQFLFGLIWPSQLKSNLTAAYISANPQATSENIVPSFWVAQRLGGRFRTLILAQLLAVPIGALLTPIMFNILEKTYGIGLNPGQLAAPTGLKIATLAVVMEKGLSYLPYGALKASIWAIFIGVFFEVLLSFKKKDAHGNEVQRFWWVPIPAALGFALILPASLNIGIALGSMFAFVWRKLSPEEGKSFDLYATPLASGLIAGEAMVGSLLIPLLTVIVGFILH